MFTLGVVVAVEDIAGGLKFVDVGGFWLPVQEFVQGLVEAFVLALGGLACTVSQWPVPCPEDLTYSTRAPVRPIRREGLNAAPLSERHEREREPSYLSCCRRTISVIQMGANGDVQPGEVG